MRALTFPRFLTALFCLLAAGAPVLAAPHTPAPGSPERKAICDAMRAHVLLPINHRALRQPILFRVEALRVEGAWAFFSGYPIYADGSSIPMEIFGDVVFETVLLKSPAGWKVVADLTRTDVPSAEETRAIRRSLPKDLPYSVLSKFWRDQLQR
jgi:hypothetical protein